MDGDALFTFCFPPPEHTDAGRQATMTISKEGGDKDRIYILGPYTECALIDIFTEIMHTEPC